MCKPAYLDNPVSSENLLHYFPFQLGYMVVLWFLMVSLNLLELFLQTTHTDQIEINPSIIVISSTGRCLEKITKFKESISLLFAVVGFTLPIIFLYRQNFRMDLFCLMNKQEPICRKNWKELSSDLDCFKLATKPNSSIEAFNSGLSAIMKSGWFS